MRAGLGRRRAPGQGGRRRGTRPAGRARKVPQLGPGGGGGTEAQGIGTGRAAHGEGGEPRSASAGLRPAALTVIRARVAQIDSEVAAGL